MVNNSYPEIGSCSPAAYQPHAIFALRVPILPISAFEHAVTCTGDDQAAYDIPALQLMEPFDSGKLLRPAIRVANRSLEESIDKYSQAKMKPSKRRSISSSVFRYSIRAATRPTPFGLFAAVGFGYVGEHTRIELGTPPVRHARIRPDGQWLTHLVQMLQSNMEVIRDLTVAINPDLRITENQLSLPNYDSETSAYQGETTVTISAPVQTVLTLAARPIRYAELSSRLAHAYAGASSTDIEAMLHKLVSHGVLVSDLMPLAHSDSPLDDIADRLPESGACATNRAWLRLFTVRANRAGRKLAGIGDALTSLDRIRERVTPSFHGLTYQCDASLNASEVTLAAAVGEEVCDAIRSVYALTPGARLSQSLLDYRELFIERYGPDARVPVLELLDEVSGLGPVPGYGAPPRTFALPSTGHAPADKRTETLTTHVQQWLSEALVSGSSEIELSDERLAEISQEWPLPSGMAPTLDVMFQLAAASERCIVEGDYRIILSTATIARGGRSMARFAEFMDPIQFKLFRNLYRHDEYWDPEVLCAEIGYLPHAAHLLNLTMMKRHYEFEVDFRRSVSDHSAKIPASDLLVEIIGGQFRLVSANRGGEVRVIQTGTVNPMRAPNIVRFLLEVSAQRLGPLPVIDFVGNGFTYFPRIVRRRGVIRPAVWILRQRMLLDVLQAASSSTIVDAVQRLRRRYQIPRYVYAAKVDRRLLFDLESPCSIAEFCAYARAELGRRGQAFSIRLEEMLPSIDEMWLRDDRGRPYAAEFVLPIVLERRDGDSSANGESPASGRHRQRSTQRRRPANGASFRALDHNARLQPLGADWTCLKLYGARRDQHQVIAAIRNFANHLTVQGLADCWFYVRYADPEPHIRVRFRATDRSQRVQLAGESMRWAGELIGRGQLRDGQITSYIRELERYGGPAAIKTMEEVFHTDSMVASSLALAHSDGRLGMSQAELGVLSMTEFLRAWGIDGTLLYEMVRNQYGAVQGMNELRPSEKQCVRGLLMAATGHSGSSDEVRTIAVVKHFEPYNERIMRLSGLIAELDALGKLCTPSSRILHSVLHMHLNRLIGPTLTQESQVYALWVYGLKSVEQYLQHHNRRLTHTGQSSGEADHADTAIEQARSN